MLVLVSLYFQFQGTAVIKLNFIQSIRLLFSSLLINKIFLLFLLFIGFLDGMLICFWSYILWYFGSDWSCRRLLPPPAVRIAALFTCLGRLFCASVAFSAASPHLTRVAGVGKHTADVTIFKTHLKWKAFGGGVWIRFCLLLHEEKVFCASQILLISVLSSRQG